MGLNYSSPYFIATEENFSFEQYNAKLSYCPQLTHIRLVKIDCQRAVYGGAAACVLYLFRCCTHPRQRGGFTCCCQRCQPQNYHLSCMLFIALITYAPDETALIDLGKGIIPSPGSIFVTSGGNPTIVYNYLFLFTTPLSIHDNRIPFPTKV